MVRKCSARPFSLSKVAGGSFQSAQTEDVFCPAGGESTALPKQPRYRIARRSLMAPSEKSEELSADGGLSEAMGEAAIPALWVDVLLFAGAEDMKRLLYFTMGHVLSEPPASGSWSKDVAVSFVAQLEKAWKAKLAADGTPVPAKSLFEADDPEVLGRAILFLKEVLVACRKKPERVVDEDKHKPHRTTPKGEQGAVFDALLKAAARAFGGWAPFLEQHRCTQEFIVCTHDCLMREPASLPDPTLDGLRMIDRNDLSVCMEEKFRHQPNTREALIISYASSLAFGGAFKPLPGVELVDKDYALVYAATGESPGRICSMVLPHVITSVLVPYLHQHLPPGITQAFPAGNARILIHGIGAVASMLRLHLKHGTLTAAVLEVCSNGRLADSMKSAVSAQEKKPKDPKPGAKDFNKPCKDFANGRCGRGDQCKFLHDARPGGKGGKGGKNKRAREEGQWSDYPSAPGGGYGGRQYDGDRSSDWEEAGHEAWRGQGYSGAQPGYRKDDQERGSSSRGAGHSRRSDHRDYEYRH